MKFTKRTFLMLGLASVFSIAWVSNGMAVNDCSSAPTYGYYCKKAGTKPICPEGCYCPGGVKKAVGENDEYDRQVTSRCKDHAARSKTYLEERGIYYCPDDFKNSTPGAGAKNLCFNDSHIYYSDTPYCNTTTTPTNSGKFCALNVQHSCPEGCYCPGGMYYYTDKTKGKITELCKNSTDYVKDVAGGTHGSGAYRCPEDKPYSNSGAKSQDDCYALDTYVSCSAGKYLPKNSAHCADCLDGYYCPGIRMTRVNPENDIRLMKCPADKIVNGAKTGCESCDAGLVPNENQTQCVTPPIKCNAGSYLPESSRECEKCPEGYYCPGGDFYQEFYDQGYERCEGNKIPNAQRTDCEDCPAGKEPDEDYATCVDKKMVIMPGYYLPANTTEPGVVCTGTKKYCPGGRFYKKSVEQGRYDCPFNADANENDGHKSCKLKLTAKQLEQGATGSGQCWKQTNPEDYKYCIYGVRFLEEEYDYTSTTSSAILTQSIRNQNNESFASKNKLPVNSQYMKQVVDKK